jgi:hypothetical protein
MFLLLLAGALAAFMIFRKKKNFSAMEFDLLIQKIIRGNGYSAHMARMIAAVARHESANFTSPLFTAHKNFFGMRPATQRRHAQDYQTPHEDPKKRYAGFDNHAHSVVDMALYLDARNYPYNFPSVRALVEMMKAKGYFEDNVENYIKGVERALPNVANL